MADSHDRTLVGHSLDLSLFDSPFSVVRGFFRKRYSFLLEFSGAVLDLCIARHNGRDKIHRLTGSRLVGHNCPRYIAVGALSAVLAITSTPFSGAVRNR